MYSYPKHFTRKINGVSYAITEEDSVKSNGVGYYKVKLIRATPLDELLKGNDLSKHFTVSRAEYYGEYSSIRAGIIAEFGG